MNIFGGISLGLSAIAAVSNGYWLFTLIYELVTYTGDTNSIAFAFAAVFALVTMMCSIPIAVTNGIFLLLNIRKRSVRWLFWANVISLALTLTICIASGILILI